MLRSLSIRDVVLIDRLDLDFRDGLSVLTGETGAGKSILLDCLGLALGGRADASLLRPGAAQASVTAAFEPAAEHPVHAVLAEHGLADGADATLSLRRVQGADGRSRAFVNDQPAGVGLLRRIGAQLVEIQGQFEQQGLLDAATHRECLDAFARLGGEAAEVARRHAAWGEARQAAAHAEAELARTRGEEDELRHAVAELERLAPEANEEARLADARRLLQNAEKLVEAMNEAAAHFDAADPALRRAATVLQRAAAHAGGRLDGALAALDRATAELAEAQDETGGLGQDIELDQGRLEEVEERLFALTAAARRHRTTVDRLPVLHRELVDRLAGLDQHGEGLVRLTQQAEAARRAYVVAAEALSRARRDAAGALDRAVEAELAPLKLGQAKFTTGISRLEEAAWGPAGIDRVAFEVTTVPDLPPGPLARIASGGELSRFLLALKVVLAGVNPGRTLIFDEVDAGVGGATAAAVGARLARLAADRQVLVVTHSPQVAALGTHHWRVIKEDGAAGARAAVAPLAAAQRREEIARMLSGVHITDEARAAADRLLEGAAA